MEMFVAYLTATITSCYYLCKPIIVHSQGSILTNLNLLSYIQKEILNTPFRLNIKYALLANKYPDFLNVIVK